MMPYASEHALQTFVERLRTRTLIGQGAEEALLRLPRQEATAGGDRDLVGVGEKVDHACLIVDGLVGRFGQTRDGRRQITAFYMTGHVANLQSVVFPSTAASLQALTPVTVIKLPHDELRAVVKQHPSLADAFWRECAVDAGVLAQWVVNLGRKSAIGRLAHLLAEFGLRKEELGLGIRTRYRLEANQYHIADAIGLTSIHVNRIFRTLRQENIVTVKGKIVEIHEYDALIRIAEFDPTYLHIGPGQSDSLVAPAGFGGGRRAGDRIVLN